MSAAIKDWDGEKKDFDFCKNGPRQPGKMVGHYTQVVWADTTHVGCGKKRCSTITSDSGPSFNGRPGDYIVCNYWPQGNYNGYSPYKTNPDVCKNGGGSGGLDAGGGSASCTVSGVGVLFLAMVNTMLM